MIKNFIRKAGLLYCLFFTACSNTQDEFEKYYNRQSDIYNGFSTAKQNSAEGLAMLLEIENQFNKLTPDQHKKYIRRLGDTFVGISSVYAAQNDAGKAIEYMQKASDAREGDIDPKFIAKIKDFDKVRNLPAFKKIIDNLKRGKTQGSVFDINANISTDNLKKDLAILKESLEEAHQGIYQYRTTAAIDDLFKKANDAIQNPMNSTGFYKLIAPVVAAINDGHTQVIIPSAPDSVKNQIPLGFTVIDNKLIIAKSYVAAYNKLIGKEIGSINNQSASSIIQFALTDFSSDGENTTHKIFLLSKPSKVSPRPFGIAAVLQGPQSLLGSDRRSAPSDAHFRLTH